MNRTTMGLAAGLFGIGIAAGFASAPSTTAHAQAARSLIGTLTCKGGAHVGMIVGSQQTLDCSYQPVGNSRPRGYTATITKVGVDIGFKNETTLVWQVIGSTDMKKGPLLVGDYGGVSAEASVALGVGANALVGGSNKSVVLQPISVQGQTGLNVALAVTSMTLRR
ncbi:MAG: hypothetical protein BGN89_13660 [Alphaproteobacteria bacterium 64-6]|jgi:hypothetical protein|nr:DUF992 domain-containing protein [Hyphomicrobium sp.]MBN9266750.1 DUF992 domain-containing protein [Hyphomicrobium sp.]OJU30236.1 MAG: hypothetical protein BGN89_13660 [Alphaproteobacteria bacterium 64-6]